MGKCEDELSELARRRSDGGSEAMVVIGPSCAIRATDSVTKDHVTASLRVFLFFDVFNFSINFGRESFNFHSTAQHSTQRGMGKDSDSGAHSKCSSHIYTEPRSCPSSSLSCVALSSPVALLGDLTLS